MWVSELLAYGLSVLSLRFTVYSGFQALGVKGFRFCTALFGGVLRVRGLAGFGLRGFSFRICRFMEYIKILAGG